MVITRRERLTAGLFVLPATLLIAAFVIWPTIGMVRTSFQQTWPDRSETGPTETAAGAGSTGRRPVPQRFVGFSNYTELLGDPAFRRSLRNTAVFSVLVVPLQTVLALLLAVWVNGPGGVNRFLRLSVFIPTTISLAVLSVVWKLIYEPATATGAGLLNGLFAGVGLPAQPFLTSPRQALPAIVLMSIWQGVGLQMMVFLSGLQQIPQQLYEAARIDGAGSRRLMWHITLPGLAPTAVFVLMITTIFALKLFVQPFLMTRGGPQGATLSIVQYVYETAFFTRDLGLACAAGSVFFLIVLVITVGLRRLSRSAEVVE